MTEASSAGLPADAAELVERLNADLRPGAPNTCRVVTGDRAPIIAAYAERAFRQAGWRARASGVAGNWAVEVYR